jgi:hypothetical protein
MKHYIERDGVLRQITLEKSSNGVDVCFKDAYSTSYVCSVQDDGTLLLYADVSKELKRTKNNGHYIVTKKEMD